ncbi:MAG TPA: c-type cytochrome [Thermoanaerobaculia bacterium]
MSSRTRILWFLLASGAALAAGCRERLAPGDAGSPATVGRTATAPTTEDVAVSRSMADQKAADPGQGIFIESGCTMCHGVTSAGIRPLTDAGPDLAGVGARRGGAPGIEAFAKSGDHPKAWEGTDADLKIVAEWLATK